MEGIQELKVEQILESFANDFRENPESKNISISFGVKVKNEGEWNISVDGKGGVEINEGFPSSPSFFYVTDYETLYKIYKKEISVFTAMGKASSKDFAPMDVGFMEGYTPREDFFEKIMPFTFHFWTKGFPKIARFGSESYTRVVHGANVAVLYYQKGLRSAWYQIKKGQHINASIEDQKNSFPTLVIFTKGEAEARIGGKYLKLKAGESALIPKDVTHEFWNEKKEPGEFIIIMFGEGA